MAVIELFILVCSVATLLYLFIKQKFNYWANQNVAYIKPKFPFGNLQGFQRKLHSSELLKNFYDQMKPTKQKFGGIYFFIKPVVVPLDLDFVKTVLVKDFQFFHDRGLYYNEIDDPLTANLLNIEGARWKNLRAKLTPTFTSGKMKIMCPTIVDVGQKFGEAMCTAIVDNGEIEMKDILARFTTDVIGTCAFGLDCNSLEDPNAEFRLMGRRVFEQPRNVAIKQFFIATFKDLSRKLHIKQTQDDVSAFFMNAVRDTIAYREENKIQRNDFMNLLIEMKNNAADPISIEEVAAQAFIFFLAGFETSSTTMSFALYELAMNQDIQEKARQSIQKVLEKHGGNLTYDAITEMTYITQCINGMYFHFI
jgi:cytochrome P450 family 6